MITERIIIRKKYRTDGCDVRTHETVIQQRRSTPVCTHATPSRGRRPPARYGNTVQTIRGDLCMSYDVKLYIVSNPVSIKSVISLAHQLTHLLMHSADH